MTQWISVKDDLPKDAHYDVLITDGKNITVAHLGNDNKTWFDYMDCFHHAHIMHQDVTHWMPLPEFPKDE